MFDSTPVAGVVCADPNAVPASLCRATGRARADHDRVEPLAHPLPIHNVFRDDEPAPSLPVDEALANAPDRRRDARGDSFYGVPAVLD